MNSQLSNVQFQKWNILTQKCCEITVNVMVWGMCTDVTEEGVASNVHGTVHR
jgi:hypothetical protein